MQHEELLALLTRARTVLKRYLFDEGSGAIRDDVAEACMAIDDAAPNEAAARTRNAPRERFGEKSAA